MSATRWIADADRRIQRPQTRTPRRDRPGPGGGRAVGRRAQRRPARPERDQRHCEPARRPCDLGGRVPCRGGCVDCARDRDAVVGRQGRLDHPPARPELRAGAARERWPRGSRERRLRVAAASADDEAVPARRNVRNARSVFGPDRRWARTATALSRIGTPVAGSPPPRAPSGRSPGSLQPPAAIRP